MTKCGKGLLPECEYHTSAGCVSPFNCPYKMENESITTATSTPLNPNVIYTTETDKDKEIARLTAENAELQARLEKAVELPVKIGDKKYCLDCEKTMVLEQTVHGCDVDIYKGKVKVRYILTTNSCGANESFSYEKWKSLCDTRAEAEARLAEIKGED